MYIQSHTFLFIIIFIIFILQDDYYKGCLKSLAQDVIVRSPERVTMCSGLAELRTLS